MTSQATVFMSNQQARAIAEEAYIYAYPMLLSYGFFYLQTQGGINESIPFNQFVHFRRVGSPTYNNHIPWINVDTLYSTSWLDLRTEPMVLTVPEFEDYRFQNFQVTEHWGHNIANRGTRNVGNGSRRYLFVGPGWQGTAPDDVDEVIQTESWVFMLFARILLEGPDDYQAVHALQDRYQLVPLSQYQGVAAPAPATEINWPTPSNMRWFEANSLEFIPFFNFLMTLMSVHPDERALFDRFSLLGIGPGKDFDPEHLAPEIRAAIEEGIEQGHRKILDRVTNLGGVVNGWQYPLDLRGDRTILTGSADAYLRRAAAANYAIWGPSAEEVVYMVAEADGDNKPLDGARHSYVLHFDSPPPVKGFWSYTVYDAKTRLLVEHPSERFKLGDRDQGLVYGEDGSLTLYIQHDSPGKDKEANWLPAPKHTFQVIGRLYWPEEVLLQQAYLPPPITKGETRTWKLTSEA